MMQHSDSAATQGKAKASEATLGIPLGIPLGAATQRRHSCGSHTVSTRHVDPLAPRLAVSGRALCITPVNPLLYCNSCLDNSIWLWDSQTTGPYKSLATPPLKQCFLRLERTPVAKINGIIKKLALSECCIMLHANANALIIAADSWARVKALPARKRRSTVLRFYSSKPTNTLEVLPGPRPQTGLGSRSGRAQMPRKGAGQDKSSIPLGPNPCQGADKDQHRHAREFNATRRRLQGPKRPGSLARSGSRSGLAKASEATLGIPLGIPLEIPLGANADATQRRHCCGSHTVSTRQTLLHLAWPCQPGLFASRLPARFSYNICRFLQWQPNCLATIEFGLGIPKQRAPKSPAAAPLKACFSTAKAMPPAT